MTVRELIEELRKYSPNLRVMRWDYFEIEPEPLTLSRIKLNTGIHPNGRDMEEWEPCLEIF